MKMKSLFVYLAYIVSLLMCLSMTTHAAKLDGDQSPLQKNLADTEWRYRVAPYAWLINMDGTSQIGMTRAHINQTFGDILSHLSFAGMLWLEADKGNFGIFLNSLYSALKDTAHDGSLSLDAKSTFGLFTGGISYKTYQSDHWGIIPFLGFRYTINDNQLTASTPAVTVNAKDNQSWIDPLIGVRVIYHVSKAWSATIEGDVGGTNTTTDYSYNINALIGYQPQTVMTNSTIYFGYRLLDQNYQTGSGLNTFVWNMRIAGPIIGIAFDF